MPVYSRPYATEAGVHVVQVQVPLVDRAVFAGTVVAEYSVEALLRYFVPTEVANRHGMMLMDAEGRVLASTVSRMPSRDLQRSELYHDIPVSPVGNGLILRGVGYRTSVGLISNTLFWMVAALSALTVWMLWGTWRHMRRRLQVQQALVAETNFRRAMENSMLTGMRAMDLEGRITYVNAAYCSMTGFSEAELIGRMPPFPHWPPDRMEESRRLFEQELQGRSPAGGIEVKVLRKDGTQFDARMYVSPLIDAKGNQTGWMTSMTNITEAKRIRDQLSASHERFTTVLEGLDAAVSVVSVQQGELLFANRSYRLWFGTDAKGHGLLAGAKASDQAAAMPAEADESVDHFGGLPTQELTETGSDPREVYVETLGRWFDVRSRYLQWTDGRLAQMLIATDVTARVRAEEQAARQADQAQITSRLVTMGEMASSVAHELNQPLTAISNYCNGMISRLKDERISTEDLLAALEKTSRQAQRAGQIIQRIRAFVKRSEPNPMLSDVAQMVSNAIELADIELRRQQVRLTSYVAARLPALMVDPILIEQVLINLMKNAGEAIADANRPPAERYVELRVGPRRHDDQDVIEFEVRDSGKGVPADMIERIYEAFYSTKSEGMGIGLKLCRSIVESHHGRMRVENLYNGEDVVGCCFSFWIPIASRLQPQAAEAAAAQTLTDTERAR